MEGGWHVFPQYGMREGICTCGFEHPQKDAGNHPCGGYTCRDATTDKNKVDAWFQKFPHMNFGVAPGVDPTESGKVLVVVVCNDDAHLHELLNSIDPGDRQVAIMAKVKCGDGSIHVYVTVESGSMIEAHLKKNAKVVGLGGHVVGAGSIHHNGVPHEWIEVSEAHAPKVETIMSEAVAVAVAGALLRR
jgi:hypothetical protein